MRVLCKSAARSSARRKSPSVNTPSTRSAASTIAVMPSPLEVTSNRPSAKLVSARTLGTCTPVRITSFTYNSRRPRAPAGCERAKSSSVNPRAFRSATARASPTARAAVVLAVGARFSGQASAGTRMSRCTVAICPRVESGFPVKAINGTPKRLITGSMVRISAVSPEFDSASTASSRVIMPISPWLASPGCTKNAGVPVLARVAAILPAIWPDFPIPVTTMRPRQLRQMRQARAKSVPRRGSCARNPSISTLSAWRPRSTRSSSV